LPLSRLPQAAKEHLGLKFGITDQYQASVAERLVALSPED